MGKSNVDIGADGEFVAVAYLTNLGHEILEKNWRAHPLEVDIISRDQSVLVFTEVKTRTSKEFGRPEQAVSATKQNALKKAAEEYMHQTGYDGEIRFDIISIVYPKKATSEFSIHHFEDAFFPIG